MISHGICESRNRKIRAGVFERDRSRGLRVIGKRNVTQREIFLQPRPLRIVVRPFARLGRSFDHEMERRLEIERPRSEGITFRYQNCARISAHDVPSIVAYPPPSKPSPLFPTPP